MKKMILILAVLAILPGAVFADWAIGGAAFYKSPVLLGQVQNPLTLNVDQVSFGGDLRLKLGWFQAEALLLFSTGNTVNSLDVYLDAGIALDIAIVRLSLGIGPNLTNNFSTAAPIQAGLNAKAGVDLMLGPVSLGVSYIMVLNLSNGVNVATQSGMLGIQLLFWL